MHHCYYSFYLKYELEYASYSYCIIALSSSNLLIFLDFLSNEHKQIILGSSGGYGSGTIKPAASRFGRLAQMGIDGGSSSSSSGGGAYGGTTSGMYVLMNFIIFLITISILRKIHISI